MSDNKDEQAAGLPRSVELARTGICLVMFALQVWTVLTWQLDDAEIRGIFLAFILLFAFAFYPATKKTRSPHRLRSRSRDGWPFSLCHALHYLRL